MRRRRRSIAAPRCAAAGFDRIDKDQPVLDADRMAGEPQPRRVDASRQVGLHEPAVERQTPSRDRGRSADRPAPPRPRRSDSRHGGRHCAVRADGLRRRGSAELSGWRRRSGHSGRARRCAIDDRRRSTGAGTAARARRRTRRHRSAIAGRRRSRRLRPAALRSRLRSREGPFWGSPIIVLVRLQTEPEAGTRSKGLCSAPGRLSGSGSTFTVSVGRRSAVRVVCALSASCDWVAASSRANASFCRRQARSCAAPAAPSDPGGSGADGESRKNKATKTTR